MLTEKLVDCLHSDSGRLPTLNWKIYAKKFVTSYFCVAIWMQSSR